ncbi:MAG: hypothetical protein J5806_14785 [Lentisphaeria bacterium]|nr:hypothetical protein [Lentisphaeria bacterium]
MKLAVFLSAVAAAVLLDGAEFLRDQRPPLDKSSYRKTVWSQVNPWFPFNKQPVHDLGGPNIAFRQFTGKNIWGQGFKLLDEYGLDGLQVEVNEPAGWLDTYRNMLNDAKALGSRIKLGLFFGCYSKTPEKTLENMKKILGQFREELKSHPNVMRVGNRPVIVIYTPGKYQPAQWKMIFDGLDKAFDVPFVYLTCRMGNEEKMRRYLTVFDGVTSYGSNGLKGQQDGADLLVRLLKKEFPQKIFEGGVHSTYTCHFHMGGLEVDLSRNYRESFDIWLKTDPDAIQITNLFDHYENSLIFPCYEREDFMLRYMQYRIAKWRGKPFPSMKTPELVVTNHIQILLGRQNLDFEVMGFPIDSEKKEVIVQLDLCNTAGEILRRFPPKKLILDEFRVERFSVPSADYARERGVVPRLNYTWNGKNYKMNYNPMTLISPSIRSYRMYWTRSTRNALKTQGSDYWTLNGNGPGGTSVPEHGISVFAGKRVPTWGKDRLNGYLRHGIKRDGLEFYFTGNQRGFLSNELALNTPDPGQALHWYHLEMENREGLKWQSLPIWEADGSRAAEVTVPVHLNDGSIRDFRIEGARVPFFHYPCSEDHQKLLLDVSGYMHNGSINGSGYGGGHLGYTGYNYYHNGQVSVKDPEQQFSIFKRDPDGRGFLRFSGKDHITIMGSTAFPGASTYELSVRPAELGRTMGLLGSGNNQISLKILPDGTIQAARGAETEGQGGTAPKKKFVNRINSKTRIEAGKWTRIAVVYDCRKLRLYLNGELENEADSAPVRGHDWINHLLVGASNKWVWDPIEHFKGDICNIRIYGRNLAPEEFLSERPVERKKNPYERKKITETLLKTDVSEYNGLSAGNSGLALTKQTAVLSKKRFAVDPDAEYLFTLKMKNLSGKSYPVYIGAAAAGISARQVYSLPGTETELIQEVKKGDLNIRVKNVSGWKPNGFVAFNADRSGSDKPNRMLAAVKSIGEGTITLKQGAPCAAKAGTLVREHCDGPTYNWAGAVFAQAGKEVSFSGKLKGIADGQPTAGFFWPGTRQFQLIVIPMGAVSAEKPLVFSEIKLERIIRK